MKRTFCSITEYIDQASGMRCRRLKTMHECIVKRYPNAIADLHYKMPTYRYAAGWVAMANQKHYLSLYTCSPAHIADFRKKHPGIKTGKGCINLRDRDPFPVDDLMQVIRHAIEQPKVRQ